VKNIEELCQHLEKKAELFREYDDATEKLLTVDVDGMEKQMKRRQSLISKIDYLDGQMREAARKMDGLSDAAWDAVRLQRAKCDIPEELWPVFEKAQEVYAIANRVRLKEPLAVDRIEEELERLTEKIKENNRSVSAKAARFSQAFRVGMGGALERSRRI